MAEKLKPKNILFQEDKFECVIFSFKQQRFEFHPEAKGLLSQMHCTLGLDVHRDYLGMLHLLHGFAGGMHSLANGPLGLHALAHPSLEDF